MKVNTFTVLDISSASLSILPCFYSVGRRAYRTVWRLSVLLIRFLKYVSSELGQLWLFFFFSFSLSVNCCEYLGRIVVFRCIQHGFKSKVFLLLLWLTFVRKWSQQSHPEIKIDPPILFLALISVTLPAHAIYCISHNPKLIYQWWW